jgi:hypothetical protein
MPGRKGRLPGAADSARYPAPMTVRPFAASSRSRSTPPRTRPPLQHQMPDNPRQASPNHSTNQQV